VARPEPSAQPDFTLAEALRAPAFWYVSLGHGAALLVVSAVQVHLVAHLNDSLGFSVTEGATVVAVLTALTMAGQVAGGMLGDRFSRRWLVTGCMVGHGLALLVLAYATAVWMVGVFTVLHGLAWGVRGPQMQSIRADYFGRSSFGSISGFSSLIVTGGSVAGPLVAGILADVTGDYQQGFTILAVLAGLGSVFWVLARPPRKPA
jgi:MFS family permease